MSLSILEPGLAVLIALTLFHSCKRGNDNSGSWDEATSTFSIPAAGLEYQLPTATECWQVAAPENISDNIKFCGVDSETGVCVMIISLDKTLISSVMTASRPVLQRIIADIYAQPEMEEVSYSTLKLETSQISGHDGYNFQTEVLMSDSLKGIDSLRITYAGYIFDTLSGSYALVATSPTPIARSLPLYLTALHRVD